MADMVIKVHRKNTVYRNPHFFVLNKGYNSGKAQKIPFANSFVLIFRDKDECDNHLNAAESLWESRFWHKYLLGSPIVYLRFEYFKNEFPIQVKRILEESEEKLRAEEEVRMNMLRSEQYLKNWAILNQTKKERAYWYNRRK